MIANLVLLNNFLHDFSAAGWIFCTVLLWRVLKNISEDRPLGNGMATFLNTTFVLMRLSLFGIIVFGLIRALAYKKYEWSATAGEGQITLLIVKHALLLVVFYAGVVFYKRAKGLMRKEINDKKE